VNHGANHSILDLPVVQVHTDFITDLEVALWSLVKILPTYSWQLQRTATAPERAGHRNGCTVDRRPELPWEIAELSYERQPESQDVSQLQL
jgi:hypothetical protein